MFTKEEMQVLRKYEEQFRRAIESDWAKFVTAEEFAELYSYLRKIQPNALKPSRSCGHCVLRLLRDVGKAYREAVNFWKNGGESTESAEVVNSTSTVKKSVRTAKTKKSKITAENGSKED